MYKINKDTNYWGEREFAEERGREEIDGITREELIKKNTEYLLELGVTN